jgi:group I intron endonuclease
MGCVYLVKNTVNGKQYVGMTTKDLGFRIRCHLQSVDSGSSLLFHRAIRKYGIESFIWRVLMEEDSLNALKESEMVCVRLFKTKVPSGYNLTDGGEGVQGLVVSEETRKRLSESHKGHVPWIKGKKHSPESIERMKEVLNSLDMQEKKRQIALAQWATEERKQKQREAMKGNTNGRGNQGWVKTLAMRKARQAGGLPY